MKRHHIILFIILLIGLFFRTYQIVERFEFAHDGDLYSWIVKDIVLNHHFRLIGQETSAPGIFIGPLFYYMLVPFFIIFNMDPIGSTFLVALIGLLTIVSFYFVFSKLFKKEVGLISSFLYAVLLTTVESDRWVVPTVTNQLWSIWYLYALFMLIRGKFYILPLLGVLIGLIWHIHLALIPTLLAIPFAIFLGRKFPNLKQMLISLLTFFVTSLPLIVFEIKHNFSQALSLINNLSYHQEGGSTGFYRLEKNFSMATGNNVFFALLFLLSPILLIKVKLLSLKELIPLYVWVFGLILFFSLSSSPISEYYFSSTNAVFMALASLCLYFLFKYSKYLSLLVLFILSIILIKNLYSLINLDYYKKGYLERKGVVEYIVKDAYAKNFPCFSINYITSPGENVGFRYFFFLKNAHVAVPGRGSPVYSIVIPDEYALKEVRVKFGHIGVIPPTDSPPRELVIDACSGANTNLTDPMFGYVD